MTTVQKIRRSEKQSTRRRQDRHTKRNQSRFAGRLLLEWDRLNLPKSHVRIVVAVSGGADSTALLLGLEELSNSQDLPAQLTVAHLDHGLRGEAGTADASAVEALAKDLGCDFELGREAVKQRAESSGDNLEQAARRARYEFLSAVAEKCGASLVLTGHTLDDQAETVLLRLMRGSGAEGLAGIEPIRSLTRETETLLVRPLVSWARHTEAKDYCDQRGAQFRVDEMNSDERFARVRVRRQLLPLMETFNPRVIESLARTAELLREDTAVLNAAAESLLLAARAEASDEESDNHPSEAGSLSVNILANAPLALRRRALRLWLGSARGDLRRLELVHLVGIEKLLVEGRGGRIAEVPGGGFVECREGLLRFLVK